MCKWIPGHAEVLAHLNIDPVSFAITCLSLGLALNTKFRLLAQLVLRQVLRYTFLTWLWRSKLGFGRCADAIYSAIDREKRRRRAKYDFEKWEIGYWCSFPLFW
jgi:hypothetical protein